MQCWFVYLFFSSPDSWHQDSGFRNRTVNHSLTTMQLFLGKKKIKKSKTHYACLHLPSNSQKSLCPVFLAPVPHLVTLVPVFLSHVSYLLTLVPVFLAHVPHIFTLVPVFLAPVPHLFALVPVFLAHVPHFFDIISCLLAPFPN